MTTTTAATATTLAHLALDETALTGGASVEVLTGNNPPAGGVMVATADSDERKFDNLDADTLARYIESTDWAPGEYLGVWQDTDGTYYVDKSEHFADIDAGTVAAQVRGELAVYDLATGESVYVN